jgi:AraC family transcriptional regulator of adaptative response/methylated-DNA-[protein]-cysteine methyltransferase
MSPRHLPSSASRAAATRSLSRSEAAPRPPRSDDDRWRAVLARDERFDGLFVTAVRTTGVYCRPSCAARHPLRSNVRFYGTPDDAEAGGFRACRRCRPREASPWSENVARVERVCRHIEANIEERQSLRVLAAVAGLSPHHFLRTFQRATGVTPAAYADARRLERLKGHLRRKEEVTMAVYEAGYGSSSRLYERAPRALGMTPGAYRSGGAGAVIRYASAATPIGRVLVGATEQGLCSVKIGANEGVLARALRDEFPAADVRHDREGVGRWIAAVVAHLDGREPKAALPLDIRATAFQRQVWEALCRIPRGETRTYQEIAREVGRPRAARAVGRACATNPVAIVVPCHRVLRGSGELGGYAYGLPVKRALLEREGARPPDETRTKARPAAGRRPGRAR